MTPRKSAAKKSAKKSQARRQQSEGAATETQFVMNRAVRLPGGHVVRPDDEDAEQQLHEYQDEEGNGLDLARLEEKGIFERRPLARRYSTAVRGDARRIKSTVVSEVDNPREPADQSEPDEGEEQGQTSGEE